MRVPDLVPDFVTTILERLESHRRGSDLGVFFDLLRPTKADVILDVGAGTGWLADRVANLSEEVYALEPNDGRLGYMRRRHPQVKSFVSHAESIPFPESYFDKLYVSMAFHNISDQNGALAEFHRILKTEGLLLVYEADPGKRAKNPELFERKVLRLGVRFLRPEELRIQTRDRGFETKQLVNGKRGYFLLSAKQKQKSEAAELQ